MDNQNVRRITLKDREILIVGTAHVSSESIELVEKTINAERPDTVCVEFCKPRFDALKQQNKWQDTDILRVIREKRNLIRGLSPYSFIDLLEGKKAIESHQINLH